MDLSTIMSSPDFLARRTQDSNAVTSKLLAAPKTPPYDKKKTSQRVIEGVIGGAVTGASAYGAMSGYAGRPLPGVPIEKPTDIGQNQQPPPAESPDIETSTPAEPGGTSGVWSKLLDFWGGAK